MDLDQLDEVSLRELPPMTKTDLMANFDRIVTDDRLTLELVNNHLETVTTGSYLLDDYTAVTSGGSTGERGVFVYDWDGWTAFWLSAFRYQLLAKWSDPELASRPVVMAWVAAAHFTHATAALEQDLREPGVRQRSLPGHPHDRKHGRGPERGASPTFSWPIPRPCMCCASKPAPAGCGSGRTRS